MITGHMIHEAFKGTSSTALEWKYQPETIKEKYCEMAVKLQEMAGICPRCGSIPSHGLLEIAGESLCSTDCPGQDSGKFCDHQTVGALIRNTHGETLLFKRGTYPVAYAGPAGHVDGDLVGDALQKEVYEEVGLTVIHADLLEHFWHPSRCRRRYMGTHGHYWMFFACTVSGELHASMRETQPDSLRWYTTDEIAALMDQTQGFLCGEEENEHLDLPWYALIREMMDNGTWERRG